MTQKAYLETLELRHAQAVTDPSETRALAEAIEDDGDPIAGYISERGRVLAGKLSTGECVLYEGEIALSAGYEWKPVGTPRLYRAHIDDVRGINEDALRLFLAQSIRNGSARQFTGWRDRIVALIPEEVGLKEAKTIRTLKNGGIEARHTYNVLDATASYAEWVNELAKEFGTTDEMISAGGPNVADAGPFGRNLVQAWLLREAAQAQLDQARHSLKFTLASQARLTKRAGQGGASVSELARSLHTDRPNLARAIKAAENDREIAEVLDSLPD
jgi:hypothetical protein